MFNGFKDNFSAPSVVRWVCFPPPIETITWMWRPTTCWGSTPLMESVWPPLGCLRSSWWAPRLSAENENRTFQQILKLSTCQLSPQDIFVSFSIQEPMLPSPARSSRVLREPVSRMHLVFDEEDDEGQEGEKCTEGGEDPQTPRDTKAGSSRGPQEPAENPAPQDSGWDAGGVITWWWEREIILVTS